MRAYTASDEEALRIRHLLRDWTSEGFLSESQREEMGRDIKCGLRRTNNFLRIVLFLFTLITGSAAVALFFVAYHFPAQEKQGEGIMLLLFAAICYAGAEFSVHEWRLYRHGIEEALAVLSVAFLCLGLLIGLDLLRLQDRKVYLAPGAGAIASFLIYRRFGYVYFFLAAMILVAFVPQYWTQSPTGQRLIVTGFYAAGLAIAARVRGAHRFDFLDAEYSIVEALLWLGLYAAVNLKLSLTSLPEVWRSGMEAPNEFPGSFYWATYALIWCLPAVMLARALVIRDRALAGLGVIVAILTLVTNKPYLGWERHSWDPMILGVLLAGIAVGVRRWLANGPGGVRNGFTAQRLSGRDKQLMSAASTAFGLALANPLTPAANSESGPRFGGGSSDGGGASSTF